jgi:hypothetical protein
LPRSNGADGRHTSNASSELPLVSSTGTTPSVVSSSSRYVLSAGSDSVNEPSACTRAAVTALLAETARTAIASLVRTLPVRTCVVGALVQPNPAAAHAANNQGFVIIFIGVSSVGAWVGIQLLVPAPGRPFTNSFTRVISTTYRVDHAT